MNRTRDVRVLVGVGIGSLFLLIPEKALAGAPAVREAGSVVSPSPSRELGLRWKSTLPPLAVNAVSPSSAAAVGKFVPGDVVVSVEGVAVTSPKAFDVEVMKFPGGSKVKVGVMEDPHADKDISWKYLLLPPSGHQGKPSLQDVPSTVGGGLIATSVYAKATPANPEEELRPDPKTGRQVGAVRRSPKTFMMYPNDLTRIPVGEFENTFEAIFLVGGVPYTGLCTEYYPDKGANTPRKRRHADITYQRGIPEGPYHGWFESGAQAVEGQFHAGREVGTWVYYREDGTVEREQDFGMK